MLTSGAASSVRIHASYYLLVVMSPNILISGSTAFDIIFSIPHDFRDSIPLADGTIPHFNAAYVANDKKEFRGGTAGNMAYWMGQQQVPALVYSAVGKDFDEKGYRTDLTAIGQDMRGPVGDYTAHAYMISDSLHQQLIIWQPNAYTLHAEHTLGEYFSPEELAGVTHGIFGAGIPASIAAHMKEFRAAAPEATIIFDPGQVTPIFTAALFEECLRYADILIGNDTEFRLFEQFTLPDHITRIETLGERGAILHHNGEETLFDAIPVETVVETTGAGDAFRAGLLAKLATGATLKEALPNALALGAECVQYPSGQKSV